MNCLVISDLHAPYHHRDTLDFLIALNKKHKFDKVICIGDELDYHAMSFHDHDPDLDGPAGEFQRGRQFMHELCHIFPKMTIIESNHGSIPYRKAVRHGIPSSHLLGYGDVVFGTKDKRGNITRTAFGRGWVWKPEETLTLKNGQRVKFVHGWLRSTLSNVKNTGMCFVQGHHHSTYEVVYHHTSDFLNWGITAGCLIDDDAYAFRYNKNNASRPVIGCAGIIEDRPVLFPMILDKKRRWTKVVP